MSSTPTNAMLPVRTLSQRIMRALNEGSNSSSTPENVSETDDHLEPPRHDLPLLRHICVLAVPDSVAISEGRTLILSFDFISFYPIRDLRMEWRIGTVMFQRTTFSKILYNLNRIQHEMGYKRWVILSNSCTYFIRVKMLENVVYTQRPDSKLRERLRLKPIMPAVRPGTPSWAQYYKKPTWIPKVKCLPHTNIYDIGIYVSSEESTSSSTSLPYDSTGPEIRQIIAPRRLLPPTPRYLPLQRVRITNLPIPYRCYPRESVQPTERRRPLPVSVRTLSDSRWPNRYLRREVTPQAVVRRHRYLNVPVPPRRFPVTQEAAHRTHRRLIPPLPPRRRLLPSLMRTTSGLDRQNSREVISQAIVRRPQNYNNEHHPPAIPRRCQYKPGHLKLTPTDRRLVTPPSTVGSQFESKAQSSQTPTVNLPSTSSTPSTVICRSPPIKRAIVLEVTKEGYLYHRPYREMDENEIPKNTPSPVKSSSKFSPPSLSYLKEGGESLRRLFEDREELTKIITLPQSSSKWVPSTWANGLSPSPDIEIESFQEIVNSEGQASIVSTETCPNEELKAVDSVITFTTNNEIQIISIPHIDHEEQVPIRFAIPVRPRSLPRRILAHFTNQLICCCTRIKMWGNSIFRTESYDRTESIVSESSSSLSGSFRFSRLLARDQPGPVIDV